MDRLKFDDISEIINENGFAIKSGLIDGAHIDEDTKEYLHDTTAPLVVGFGLPRNFVVKKAPEQKEGSILVFKDNEWVYDEDLFEKRRVEKLEVKIKVLKDELEVLITRLERKKNVKRITSPESNWLDKLTNTLFDLEELDLSNPDVVLPEIPTLA